MNKRGSLFIKVFIISIYLFLIISVAEAVTEKLIIDAKSSYVLNGKNVTVVGVNEDIVNFYVDGIFGQVRKDHDRTINGVLINVTGVSRTPPKVIVYLTVDFVCGDNICSDLESQLICCKDCGCFTGADACINNVCGQNISSPVATYDCYSDTDCADEDPCTIETCNTQVTPYRCEYPKITACINGDLCCPLNCEDTQDSDCINIDRCKRHDDCDDGNPCTAGTCDGTPKRCVFVKTEGCPSDNQCMAVGSISLNNYCDISGVWLNKRSDDEKCSEPYECISGACTLKRCGQNSFILKIFRISIFSVGIIAAILLIFYLIIIVKRGIKE